MIKRKKEKLIIKELSKEPVRDRAEHNTYFPSDYSLSVYTSPKTDFDGFKFKKAYEGGKYKVLMVASDERYVQMKNGKLFSTGNHPVETLLPMLHIHHAGFEIDVATLSGNSVKLEMWAMPNEDKNVMDIYEKYLPKLENPLKLSDVLKEVTAEDSPYLAVFFPGGHGALVNLPESRDVREVLKWAMEKDRKIVTLCHGPAALLAGSIDEDKFLFDGYKMTVFPDSLDEGANQEIGYMPGKLKWLLADKLEKLGVKIVNTGITGEVCKDRNVLTGDSPLAANNLGILTADELLAMVE
ncbi:MULTISPECIES: glyoxalase III HchA [Fusobacterium]|uniref:glyoxalase III HchA n=2 Tax=Fusobacteriaceae TaxID=203492 RepID=UPI002A838A33|nr:glyoxalase III HchA [Fusobacterium sp.]